MYCCYQNKNTTRRVCCSRIRTLLPFSKQNQFKGSNFGKFWISSLKLLVPGTINIYPIYLNEGLPLMVYLSILNPSGTLNFYFIHSLHYMYVTITMMPRDSLMTMTSPYHYRPISWPKFHKSATRLTPIYKYWYGSAKSVRLSKINILQSPNLIVQ